MGVHISAERGAIASRVLLPGDPLRAKHIAETFFSDAVCYNTVRGMLGFTGTYRGERVSVQSTGMGIPSISIYAHELMAEYGVRTLVRVGTCGALRKDMNLRDVVIAMSACTDSATNRLRFGGCDYAATADAALFVSAVEAARRRGIAVHCGPVLTSDTFYSQDTDGRRLWREYGVLAVEMETNALYTLAAGFGCRALSILTVSDSVVTKEQTTSAERETSFDAMVELALETMPAEDGE